ncbi:restriction endonuclease subunit S [Vibrio toranzoniae]|uniref:restriction endonuclease subunit S n=1 Tax=Vibrio toranzoniae TaxID=1194427 RepID=UPI0013787C4F|nr:restriction endonuclease subunit S [Vibrio toranzoniae]NAZ97691.1 restriction endonuclease subunit S [Vibrio toranzoniae]
MTGRYKAYPEYKESVSSWCGIVPSHWNDIKFKWIIEEKKKLSNPALPSGSISFGEVILKNEDSLAPETKASYQEVLVGELLINPLNLNFDLKSLRTALSTIDVVVSTGYIVAHIDKELNSNYMRWVMHQFDVSHMKTMGSGVRQTINFTDIANSAVCIAPYEEQQKIANFLDHETAKIDTLITKQEKLIELLKEKRQAVISHAVTKGLNPDAPMKDSGVEWLGEVPEHWGVLKLKHLIQSLDSGCSVNAADTPAKNNEVGVLKTSCVYTRRFRVIENKTVLKEDLLRVKCPVRKGAIIISRMNTPELVGASALVNTDVDNIYLPDRLWQTNFSSNFHIVPEFLAHFMTVEGFRNQISLSAEGASSSMQNIAKEDYLGINSLLPPVKEQTKIIRYIKNSEVKFLRLEEQANSAIELMKERKTALISAAVTGKIDVRDWQGEA